VARRRADDGYEEVPPDPAATIESLRALGYSLESAIADLVDNSIAAGARSVQVVLHWGGSAQSWCAIVDDGIGMAEDGLRAAMRIGSGDPLADRGPNDLGRFGFGLKTASFSQCRELSVMSTTTRSASSHVRSWDLDHVREVGRWELRRSAPSEADALLRRLMPGSHGTVVLWRRLEGPVEPGSAVDDADAHNQFLERVAHVDRHLAMTFERFLSRREEPLTLRLNARKVKAWDPFLTSHDATQRLPAERLMLRGCPVIVSPFVLPHRSKLPERSYDEAAGPLGWNAQQGFYVFRGDRLITAGDWLGLGFTRDDSHNLARIAVDVPVELDLAWSLDVTKATVRPPAALRNDLKRIATGTRKRARLVLTHRGAVVGPRRRRSVVPLWHQRRRHGDLVFRLNRSHPLIVEVDGAVGAQRRLFGQLLDVIEETVPVPALPTSKRAEHRMPFDGKPPPEVTTLAAQLYESFLHSGLTRAQAAERLTNTEPFNDYPEVIEAIVGTT
jgi:hypothetical protein